MEYLHLTAGEDGISRFEDRTVALELQDFAPPAQALFLSTPWMARRLLFLTLPAGWVGEQHPSPKRQVALCLAGTISVEAGDGERREIGPGECRLAVVQLE